MNLITMTTRLDLIMRRTLTRSLKNFKIELGITYKNCSLQTGHCLEKSKGTQENETYSSFEYDKIFLAKKALPGNSENSTKPSKLKFAEELSLNLRPLLTKSIEVFN